MIQRILKPDNKVVVIVDFREDNASVKDYIQGMGSLVKPLSLKIGDYVCSDRVCIERKTGEDFISSLTDGRLFEQAKELKANFSKPIMIIEGNYTKGRINENAIKSAIASIVLDYEIPVIMTRDDQETAKIIFWFANREQITNKKNIGIKGKKKPKDIKDLQEHVISSLPGVSTVLSKRILENFGTIKRFVNASETQLAKIDGIGKVMAKNLKRLLNEKYGGNT
jgi:Fanconi anemia group M protein